jgi:hypothetical protein
MLHFVSKGRPSVLPGAVRFALRDLVIALTSGGLWWLDAVARARGTEGAAATILAVLAGLSAVGCGFLMHEWGHLAGALASGARVEFPAHVASLYLFKFDVVHNDRRQFLAMSYGGYIASLVAAALLVSFLPSAALSGKVGLALTALGLVAGFAAELPITLRVLRGGPLPSEGAVYVRAD